MSCIVQDAHGQHFAKLPLDHRAVVQERPHAHIYRHVERLFDAQMPAIMAEAERITLFAHHVALDAITTKQQDTRLPFWDNGYFIDGDARALCGMIGAHRPKRIIEIGSGNSTKFARWAIRTFDTGTKITSIDPQPRAEIADLCDEVVRSSLLSVDPALFETLEADDILFFDGSHLTLNGTDTTYFFLEALPIVKPGVLVHIHDILLPFEYNEPFTQRGYSEQYMLAAVLLNSPSIRTLLPSVYLSSRGIKLFPSGGSFWMMRAS